MKGTAIILLSAFALALCEDSSIEESEEIEVNANGCPVDYEIPLTVSHDTYCNLFYTCERGERLERPCPVGLMFNSNEGVCDWPNNVDCDGKEVYDFPEETTSEATDIGRNSDPRAAPQICAQVKTNGVLVAHEICNKFYVCNRGLPAVMDCSEGLMYNSKYGYCDWAYKVECGDRIIPSAK